ncbi:UDP-N-acetylmuramoyl-tripeptide--D-alanyl-D-alanine ligase [hydrothermal vent metagenome]|uniref:UDP-N-acetylmuramoyl-tripeptide--D-alanyl-D-alanine ligase n=1 Tax=hydrothermal vent metagenome TaxID=652676 RepID=A0A3B0UVS1_9ZZZZ
MTIKHIMRNIVASILATLSRGIVRKYKPTIVMVTGSVGKTSTKDAIAAALSGRFFLYKSEKSFNSEFGVPLTIIGSKNPWTNAFAWLRVFREALALLFLPNHYPELLVLEVGADRPGDLARILRIATPNVVVVTRLPDVPVHVEAYPTPQSVRDEEFAPAYALAPSAPLIVSADDQYALMMAKRLPARVITYGTEKDADVRFENIRAFEEDEKVEGMQADVHICGETERLVVRGSAGRHQVAPGAVALAVAQVLDIPIKDALSGLSEYAPPPGRGRLLHGKNGSCIIDDSYNASPAAVDEALITLKTFIKAKRRIAVLGDMLELGRYSVEEHKRIGTLVAGIADIVIAVGVRSRGIADSAREAGLAKDAVFTFDSAFDAVDTVSGLAQKGDLFLVKGSQSIRAERIVEALLADPLDKDKLVRQEHEWKSKS